MKTLAFIIAIFATSAVIASAELKFSVPQAEPPSDDMVLESISDVETGGNRWVVGSRKERTAYQFRASTWKTYSKVPHSTAASHPQEAKRVAKAYLSDIRAKLKVRGYPATPFFIAVSWNAGPNFASIPATTRDYAERVSNLVEAREARVARLAKRVAPRPPSVVAPKFDLSGATQVVAFSIPGVRPTISFDGPTVKTQRFPDVMPKPLFAMVSN